MKNVFKRITMLLMLLLTVVVSAKPMFDDVIVSTLKSKTINLQLSNFDGNVDVLIKDIQGVLLYEEEFKGAKLSKSFNLDLLPDGSYTIELSSETRINTIPLKIENSTVKVLEGSEVIIYKPVVRIKDDLVYISKLSMLDEKISMELYEKDAILYKSTPESSITFGKVLDISNLPKGEYTLVLNYANRTHETTIKK